MQGAVRLFVSHRWLGNGHPDVAEHVKLDQARGPLCACRQVAMVRVDPTCGALDCAAIAAVLSALLAPQAWLAAQQFGGRGASHMSAGASSACMGHGACSAS